MAGMTRRLPRSAPIPTATFPGVAPHTNPCLYGSIQHDGGSIHVAVSIRYQKRSDLGHLFERPDPSERAMTQILVTLGRRKVDADALVQDARCEAVGGDAVAAHLLRERLGEPFEGR